VIRSNLLRLAAVGATAISLSACALLSSPDPVQTYRFGGVSGQPAALVADPILVSMRRAEMPAASEGDKLLGVTGTETAYIGGARWISPASDLFTASLENAFASQATRVRLIGPRELARSTRSLDIDIRSFETRYPAPEAVPTVVVSARVRLLTLPERQVKVERIFTVEQPAAANRVGAIVEAYDLATRDLNTQIVAWTEANAA
jgi:cholesterol transport system auxiliary component